MVKTVGKVPQSYEGLMLWAMYRECINLEAVIRMADYYDRPKEKEQAFGMLDATLGDVVIMLRGKVSLDGRYAKAPKTPEDMIEELRVGRDIELIAIDIAIKDKPKMPFEREEAFLERAQNILEALKLRIKLTKPIMMERWPGSWTPEFEAEFEKILKMEL